MISDEDIYQYLHDFDDIELHAAFEDDDINDESSIGKYRDSVKHVKSFQIIDSFSE